MKPSYGSLTRGSLPSGTHQDRLFVRIAAPFVLQPPFRLTPQEQKTASFPVDGIFLDPRPQIALTRALDLLLGDYRSHDVPIRWPDLFRAVEVSASRGSRVFLLGSRRSLRYVFKRVMNMTITVT